MRIGKIIKSSDGFTLIEMLVAASVSSIILLMVYTAYSSIIRTVNYGQRTASYYEELNMALRQIDYDIANTYWKKDRKNLIFICETRERSSVLDFVTSEYKNNRIVDGLKKSNTASDIHEVSYYLKKDEDRYNLIRRTDLHFDDNPTEGGTDGVLLDDVRSLKFEFKYRSDWKDSWDSRDVNKLPLAVRTSITVADPFGKDDSYIFITLPNISNE